MLRGSQPDLLLRAGKPEILPDRHGIFRLPGNSFFNRFAPKNDTIAKTPVALAIALIARLSSAQSQNI